MTPFLESDEALWSRTLEVNLIGAAPVHAARRPAARRAGRRRGDRQRRLDRRRGSAPGRARRLRGQQGGGRQRDENAREVPRTRRDPGQRRPAGWDGDAGRDEHAAAQRRRHPARPSRPPGRGRACGPLPRERPRLLRDRRAARRRRRRDSRLRPASSSASSCSRSRAFWISWPTSATPRRGGGSAESCSSRSGRDRTRAARTPRLGARRELDEGGGHLLQPVVGHADDLDEADRRMGREERLDLERRDVLAADLEHVLEPAVEADPAELVQAAPVAGVEPAAGIDCGRGEGSL